MRKRTTQLTGKSSTSGFRLPQIHLDPVPIDTPLKEDDMNRTAFGGKEFRSSKKTFGVKQESGRWSDEKSRAFKNGIKS